MEKFSALSVAELDTSSSFVRAAVSAFSTYLQPLEKQCHQQQEPMTGSFGTELVHAFKTRRSSRTPGRGGYSAMGGV